MLASLPTAVCTPDPTRCGTFRLPPKGSSEGRLTDNVLAALPKSAHSRAGKALAEIWNAEGRRHARDAVKAFDAAYGAKFPRATAKITEDVAELLTF